MRGTMHKRTLFILPVIAGVLCLAFPVVLEQLGTPRLLPDGVDSLLGMVGMTAVSYTHLTLPTT